MRASLSFLTSTSATAAEWPTAVSGHTLEVLGWDRAERRVYLAEHGPTTQLHVMATRGEHAGVAVPVAGDLARIEALRRKLVPLEPTARAGWELHTRVVQRRGLRIEGMSTPVRKYALGVTVTQHVAGRARAHGRARVTAYLRPRAAIEAIWWVPSEPLTLAIVAYCGVPAGVGFDRQTAILARPTLQ